MCGDKINDDKFEDGRHRDISSEVLQGGGGAKVVTLGYARGHCEMN